MDTPGNTFSLVERKKYDEKMAHQIAMGIWWVGYIDSERLTSHNPWLIADKHDAVLLNPGSRSDKYFRVVSGKVSSIIDPRLIQHIVVLHNDPDRCASLPLFEKIVQRDVKIYAPARVAASIKHYGCKHPIISLDDGDSIILKSGRAIDYYAAEDFPPAGSGLLYDKQTATVFCGNLFGNFNEEWNLFASAPGSQFPAVRESGVNCSKKALMQILNKIERLSPDRICMHYGPVIEEDIDGYLKTARNIDTEI